MQSVTNEVTGSGPWTDGPAWRLGARLAGDKHPPCATDSLYKLPCAGHYSVCWLCSKRCPTMTRLRALSAEVLRLLLPSCGWYACIVDRCFKGAAACCLGVVFSHVHMSGSRWGCCHMLEASMHQLHTSLDPRVLLPVATPPDKASRPKHTARSPILLACMVYSPDDPPDTYSTLRTLLCDGPACGLEIQATIVAHPQ